MHSATFSPCWAHLIQECLAFITKPRDDLIQMCLRRAFPPPLSLSQIALSHSEIMTRFFSTRTQLLEAQRMNFSASYWLQVQVWLPAWVLRAPGFQSRSYSWEAEGSMYVWDTERQTWLPQSFHAQHIWRQSSVCSCSQDSHVQNILSQIHIVLKIRTNVLTVRSLRVMPLINSIFFEYYYMPHIVLICLCNINLSHNHTISVCFNA